MGTCPTTRNMNNNEQRTKQLGRIVKILRQYNQVSLKQAAQILDTTEDITRSMFKSLVKQNNVIYNEINETLVMGSYNDGSYNKKLGFSIDLLLAIMKENPCINFGDSINQMDNEPFTICFQVEDVLYDVIYISKGEEKKINNKMLRLGIESNYLVIVENEAQVDALTFSGIPAIYTIAEGELVNVEQ